MAKFRYRIEHGERGTWQWQITNPAGEPWAWGASTRAKKIISADLSRTCQRLNRDIPQGRNHQIKIASKVDTFNRTFRKQRAAEG